MGELLDEGFAELGREAPRDQLDQLEALVDLLSQWASRINLTGHRDPEEMTVRLVLDAVALRYSIPELGFAAKLADLGSGAGFPGLPIAILCPALEVRLIESRLKRNHFQREVRRRLGLGRVEPLLGRADELEPAPSDVVVAQAMAQPAQALEWMNRWARPGGLLVLPASEGASKPEVGDLVAELLEQRRYRVPISRTERLIWVGRKR